MATSIPDDTILLLHNRTDQPMQMRYLQINKHHWNGDHDNLNGLILTDDTEIVLRKQGNHCVVSRRKI